MRLTAIAALTLLFSSQQSPLQQQDPPKASVEGTVLQVGTGEPIVGARVTLTRVQTPLTALPAVGAPPLGGPTPPGAIVATGVAGPPGPTGGPGQQAVNPAVNTDGQGKFVLKDIDPGQYRILFANNGYARTEYGQKVFNTQGTTVNLVSGQALRDLVVHMTPAGTVTGRIRDIAGKPLVGVQVQLMRASYNGNGQRSFQSAGSTRTDDRGEYRLYWVTPGRYYLNAGSSGGPVNIGGGGASPNEVQDAYVSTYYPNVTDISLATTLDVRPGTEVSGVDVSVSRQQLQRVRGRVLDARTGRPPQAVTLSVSSRTITGGGFTMFGSNQRYNPADGSFELRDMAPGPYVIGAVITETSGLMSSPSNPQQPRAQASVTVVNADIENLALTIFAPVSLPGRLNIEGQSLTTLTSLDRVRVQFLPPPDATSFAAATSSSQPIAADGTFKLDNLLPGNYRVTVSGIPPGYYLKGAQLDQTDILGQIVPFSESVRGPLDIVLSPNGGEITGTVADEKQTPARGVQVVLIPGRRNRLDLYKTAISDESGRFTIRGITPGDYNLFAWEAIEQFAYYDADFLQAFEARAKTVHVAEGAKNTSEVRLIAAEGR